MRESVIDVLFYLFDDLLDDDVSAQADVEEMADQLNRAGFASEDVGRAMTWFSELSSLNQDQLSETERPPLLRIFSEREAVYIDQHGQNYLLGLLRRGVINNALLEKIIERALALEEPLEERTLRWVAAMVVLNIYGYVDDIHALGLDEPIAGEQVEFLQ